MELFTVDVQRLLTHVHMTLLLASRRIITLHEYQILRDSSYMCVGLSFQLYASYRQSYQAYRQLSTRRPFSLFFELALNCSQSTIQRMWPLSEVRVLLHSCIDEELLAVCLTGLHARFDL